MTESGRERFNHPQLTPEENALQRGGDPQPPHHDAAPTKPTYRSDPARRATLKGMLPSIFERRRFRQDLLLPYLLIRAFPGDHGIRPIPQQRSASESPDIVVVPGAPAEMAGLEGQHPTAAPAVGQPHVVFVRLWNLGLLPAIGVTLSVSETHTIMSQGNWIWTPPVLLGQRFLDLPDCYSPACHAAFKLENPWVPQVFGPLQSNYWASLIANVSCFDDPAPD